MSELNRLEAWTAPLLERLEPAERKQLARLLGTELRRSQRERIADQRNPDGSAYAPRRAEAKAGRIRRKGMFTKLKTAKYLKMKYNENAISVGFFSDIARLARVHQYGLRDRVDRGGPEVQYAQRELLGLTRDDLALIQDILIQRLT